MRLKIQEIRKKADSDLLKLLAELKEDVRTLRFKVASKEIKNHQLLRQAKKTISRVLTVLKERQYAR